MTTEQTTTTTSDELRRAAELVERLPELLIDARRRRRASMETVAYATGLSTQTIRKVEHDPGGSGYARTVVILFRWLADENGTA